ncbi:MAG: hypothetical protein MI745_02990 [Pseudomonadales bacterium]|nr:hypothetical protein [Pseudomonadales bacterium]
MGVLEYLDLKNIERCELLRILNKEKIRKHLVPHEKFNKASLDEWISCKVSMDSTKGCKVQGVRVDGAVAGWCGIQLENGAYEIAIVLDEKYWGLGVSVFKDVMTWASELGHGHVVLNLFNTRPEYKFLTRMASRVHESTLWGQKYTSYELGVPCKQEGRSNRGRQVLPSAITNTGHQ